MTSPDWELLSTFVAVARAGSLTAGAQTLGISQPTAGRHVQSLEDALGTPLFVRHARGLSLTEEGDRLLTSAQEVADRVEAIFRDRPATPEALAGTVRISAAEPIGVHAIAPCLAALRQELPDVALELVIDHSPANLSSREADIAIRMFRPRQLDLVASRIGEVEIGMFASQAYLERHGAPQLVEPGAGHTFIGYDRDATWHQAIAKLGLSARDFAYRCDSIPAQIQAARDGVGIAALHAPLAARCPELARVLPELSLPGIEMWLVMHRELRGHGTVRAVHERLRETLTRYVQTPGPEPYC